MIRHISKLFILLFTVFGLGLSAQQEAMHTQFVYNKQSFNPGYTGYKEVLSVTALSRSQWVGFKGAPRTQVITFETPLQLDEIAVGATIMHDKIGPTSELTMSGDIAYRARLTNRSTLSFGAKFTASLYQANLVDLDLISDYYGQTDDYFLTNPEGVLLPNVGFGVFWHRKDAYASIACPKMLRNKLDKKGTGFYDILEGRTEPTIYMSGGRTWKINKDYKIQPNVMIKGTLNAPLSVGTYVSLIYMDYLEAGVFYYFNEIAGGIIQWQFNKNWKLGYSLDLATSQMITTNFGSHEVMINYSLAAKRKRIIYPRYF